MHSVDDYNFQKITQAITAGPTDLAYESAIGIGFKWLGEYEMKLLKLTDEQAKTLKDLLSRQTCNL